MKIQLLSDLHLEAHPQFQPRPAPGADVLVLAGDIGSYQAGSLLSDADQREHELATSDAYRFHSEIKPLLIEQGLAQWCDQAEPDAVSVERVFSQHNVRTVMGTAQASGIALLTAARRGLPVAVHTPSEVKAAVTGSGRADKQQVTSMVTRILRLDTAPRPADAADALALAICHIWRGSAQNRIQEAVQKQQRTQGVLR